MQVGAGRGQVRVPQLALDPLVCHLLGSSVRIDARGSPVTVGLVWFKHVFDRLVERKPLSEIAATLEVRAGSSTQRCHILLMVIARALRVEQPPSGFRSCHLDLDGTP